MYNEYLYHGTEINRGNRMLKSKAMEESTGDRHWLGDGSYFYEDDFYAFKWIRDMFKRKFKHNYKTINELVENYSIIIAEMNVPKERIFNLDNPRHKILFDRVYANCENKKDYSQRFKDTEIVDGVVLNIMFKEMDYREEYDVVIATFKMREDKYKSKPIRLDFMPEKQICVKNLSSIKPSNLFEYKDKVLEYENLIISLNFNSEKSSNVVYNKSNRNRRFSL
ncbi:MAG: hypothetical protein AB6733_19215 [Clostridiaceae bacterium]